MNRILVGVVLVVALCAWTPGPALAHQGNPNFRSNVLSVTPKTPGISVEVVNFDDHLLLRSGGGHEIVVMGYEREPYARIRADRTVQVNTNSEAYYVNQDRFGGVNVPGGVGKGAPHWKTLARSGRFEWHDHRMHYMSRDLPPQVTDKDVRTFIFNWSVPLQVDGRPAAVRGNLYWVPRDGGSGMPSIAPIVFGGIVVLLALWVLMTRRRRRGHHNPLAPARKGGTEAW